MLPARESTESGPAVVCAVAAERGAATGAAAGPGATTGTGPAQLPNPRGLVPGALTPTARHTSPAA
ncbi:hypothetical protein AB0D54_16950 [Streptomyces xanthophaeus]|uniref:hypothetical protein n=1 Tax=Streptomyces xanthophaeus TaxID=67385 RepID=UPI00342356A9